MEGRILFTFYLFDMGPCLVNSSVFINDVSMSACIVLKILHGQRFGDAGANSTYRRGLVTACCLDTLVCSPRSLKNVFVIPLVTSTNTKKINSCLRTLEFK